MICEVNITGLGLGALDFIEDQMLILFSDCAGNGLEDYSVRITMPQLNRDIIAGDHVRIGESEYTVTAVGEKAMETFRLLGHCTLRFDGSSVPVLPGTLHLEEKPLPEVAAGKTILFY